MASPLDLSACAQLVAHLASPFAVVRSSRSTPSGSEALSADRGMADLDQLEAAAAEIADDAVGVGDAGEHALPRPIAFLLAGEDARLEADGVDPGEEGGAVRGVAHGRGGDDAGADDAHLVDQQAEAVERGQRPLLRRLDSSPVAASAAAEPGQHLLVEDHRRDPLARPNRRRGGPNWSRCR